MPQREPSDAYTSRCVSVALDARSTSAEASAAQIALRVLVAPSLQTALDQCVQRDMKVGQNHSLQDILLR